MERPFDSFLESKHGEDYHGYKDKMVEDFERWLEELDGNEIIDLANKSLASAINIIRLILPLAKGYVAEHPAGVIQKYCDEAEAFTRNGYLVNTQRFDPLYEQAKQIVISEGVAQCSLLQRKLKIGYAHSAHYLDKMEEEGIVSPADGSFKPRQVLIKA